MSRKRKIYALATVFALSTLVIAGTFAWTNFSAQIVNVFSGLGSGNGGTDPIGPGGTLHNDHSEGDENRQVYIENWGSEPLFVRIRLDEYMEMGLGAGYKSESINQETGESIPHPGNLAESVVSGASIDVVDSWTTHVPNESTPHECDTIFHDYWQWEMGGQKFFFPASESDREDPSFVATNSPANLTEESVNVDGIYAVQTRSSEVLTMAQWLEQGGLIGDYWVIDTDGWAYWAAPLSPGDTTGLLLNRVIQTTQPQYDYFYGINVVAQMATRDLHEFDNYERFGDEANGGWTDAGRLLMKSVVGVEHRNFVTIVSNSTEHMPYEMWIGASRYVETELGSTMFYYSGAPVDLWEVAELLPLIQYSDDFQIFINNDFGDGRIWRSYISPFSLYDDQFEYIYRLSDSLVLPEEGEVYIAVFHVGWTSTSMINPEYSDTTNSRFAFKVTR